MKILFAVASWGLGHATRDLGLIKALLAEGHQVTILSRGRALSLLRDELDASCAYLDFPDIPAPLSRMPFFFYVKMAFSLPEVFITFRREHNYVKWLQRRHHFDRVVSDSRYGVFLREVPSFYITHSLRQIVPGRSILLEALVEGVQKGLLSGAKKILVPDQEKYGLAGTLNHNLAFDWSRQIEYLGILSSVRRLDLPSDVDYFITVSGPEPQRTLLEELALKQARALPGRVVITLGRPDLPPGVSDDGRVAVHTYMDRREQEEMLNRARMVITRSGYTTLMELAEVGKKALLIPTPGQSEQEYLGAYHERRGTMHSVAQNRVDLPRDVVVAEGYKGIRLTHPTGVSVQRFLQAVLE